MSGLKLTTAVDGANPTVHDLELEDGDLVWLGLDPYDAEGQAAMIAQRVKCRILLIAGEWYLDQHRGTPWREILWAKGTSAARIERVFRSVIAGTPGIASVTSVRVARDHVARSATVTFEAVGDAQRQIGPITLDLPFYVRET